MDTRVLEVIKAVLGWSVIREHSDSEHCILNNLGVSQLTSHNIYSVTFIVLITRCVYVICNERKRIAVLNCFWSVLIKKKCPHIACPCN